MCALSRQGIHSGATRNQPPKTQNRKKPKLCVCPGTRVFVCVAQGPSSSRPSRSVPTLHSIFLYYLEQWFQPPVIPHYQSSVPGTGCMRRRVARPCAIVTEPTWGAICLPRKMCLIFHSLLSLPLRHGISSTSDAAAAPRWYVDDDRKYVCVCVTAHLRGRSLLRYDKPTITAQHVPTGATCLLHFACFTCLSSLSALPPSRRGGGR